MTAFSCEKALSRAVLAIPPSGIRKFFDIVSEMKDAISLGVGEPDFVTPSHIRESAVRSIRAGDTHYTSNWGTIELREAISRYMRERCGADYSAKDEIIVTVGASEGIDLAMRTLINPGDEVLVPEPSYVSYQPEIALAGGVAAPIKTSADIEFRLSPQAVLNAITPNTKALILPYPNNPTGAVMPRADLEKIAKVIEKTNIAVVSDEIYSELTYGGLTHTCFASLPGMRERTITLNGFSKAFAMTGWRIGYLCAPREICAQACKIHQYTALCAPSSGQAAALCALETGFETGFEDVGHMRAVYDRRRRVMVDGFRKMGFPCFEPLGAFYVFPDITKTGLSSEDFCLKLLAGKKVATVPGTAFGKSGEGYIRCSYATATDKLFTALERIAEFAEGK